MRVSGLYKKENVKLGGVGHGGLKGVRERNVGETSTKYAVSMCEFSKNYLKVFKTF